MLPDLETFRPSDLPTASPRGVGEADLDPGGAPGHPLREPVWRVGNGEGGDAGEGLQDGARLVVALAGQAVGERGALAVAADRGARLRRARDAVLADARRLLDQLRRLDPH